ncbi:MAG: TetR/AcrR family transcriptional regulator [Spirochaetes bacterium]|nr:TetR/AcrR family transcriptional regulator [Spirochaetota bacterium]HOE20475.1 TetR/AcrR family transcriptional regulator [Spirochaetota bacterium]
MTKGIQTKQAVIERITEHIHCYGFSNTSLHDIIAISGVKKGNLYFHFKNKEALVLEVLQSAFNNHQQYIAKHTSLYSNPIQKIFAMLDAVFTYHAQRTFLGGCIFGNTAVEMADKNPAFKQFIADVFHQWTQWIATQLDTAKEQGLLASRTPTQELSHTIVAALEGGIMLAKVSKNASELSAVMTTIKNVIQLYATNKTNNKRKHNANKTGHHRQSSGAGI